MRGAPYDARNAADHQELSQRMAAAFEQMEQDPNLMIADFAGRKIGVTDADLCNVDLAYAITIRKEQGSQFKSVVILITKCRLLDRTLLYTALTRGIEQVILLGDRWAFNEAVVNPPLASLRKARFWI